MMRLINWLISAWNANDSVAMVYVCVGDEKEEASFVFKNSQWIVGRTPQNLYVAPEAIISNNNRHNNAQKVLECSGANIARAGT